MTKYTLYLGLNDKDTKKQVYSTIECYKSALHLCAEFCGGATIYEADGVYTHENGTIVIEHTLKIEIYTDDTPALENLILALKIGFNQESILVQAETVTSKFM